MKEHHEANISVGKLRWKMFIGYDELAVIEPALSAPGLVLTDQEFVDLAGKGRLAQYKELYNELIELAVEVEANKWGLRSWGALELATLQRIAKANHAVLKEMDKD